MGTTALSRRQFIKATLTATGGLMIGASLPRITTAKGSARLNAFLTIEPDGKTIIGVSQPDMGQGMYTTMSMLVAEEFDADWAKVSVKQLPLMLTRDDEGNMAWKYVPQDAGGSTSVISLYQPLREFGARARQLMLRAAAARWSVAIDALETEPGKVIHRASGRSIPYADLAQEGVALEPASEVPPLKSPSEFRLIGKEVVARKVREVVDGTTAYGIDVQMPGMRHAVIARCPYFDGELVEFDDTDARKVPGVLDVVTMSGPGAGKPYSTMAPGVAVIADSTWAAIRGRDALKIRWDEGPFRNETTAGFDDDCQKALDDADSGLVVRSDGDLDAALDDAATVVTRRYRLPYVHHATMEPQNCYADVRDDGCTVIGPMQMPAGASRLIAGLTGFDRMAIDIRMTRLGGGFGRRLTSDYAAEAVLGESRELPYSNHGGPTWNPGRLARVLKVAADEAGWGRTLPEGEGLGIAGHFTFGGYAAWVAHVQVGQDGRLRVLRLTGAVDCGLAVNPNGIRAQMEGGACDALSTALGEEVTIDGGRHRETNFHQYRLMRIDQAPRAIDVHIVQGSDQPAGLGEPPVPPLAPALTNAIYAATGKRIRALPIADQLTV